MSKLSVFRVASNLVLLVLLAAVGAVPALGQAQGSTGRSSGIVRDA
jgi:hypothetical protein